MSCPVRPLASYGGEGRAVEDKKPRGFRDKMEGGVSEDTEGASGMGGSQAFAGLIVLQRKTLRTCSMPLRRKKVSVQKKVATIQL